jgi:hypothetical protein
VLGHHGGHHRQQFFGLLEFGRSFKGPVGTQGTDHLLALLDGDTDERQLPVFLGATRTVEKARLLADAGDGQGVATLDHLADDAFAELVLDALDRHPWQAVGHFDVDFVAQRIQDGDGAANHVFETGQNFQNPVERFFQIQGFTEGLADGVQQGDVLDALGRVGKP